MSKPSIILTAQFTTPKAKSFDKYVSYMTRKEALLKNESRNIMEDKELQIISKAIESHDMEYGELEIDSSHGKDKKEIEAIEIIKYQKEMQSSSSYEKYINYMSRQYALEQKNNKNQNEELELGYIQKKLKNMVSKHNKDPVEKAPEKKTGVFSIYKETMTNKDIKEVHEIINKAQKNGSVFYQDVISFDTDFLIKEKIYNPKNDELDEKRIQQASRKMMQKMFDSEGIDTGYWFASIHRNTDNIHIHFGSVETKNTRKIITVEENGDMVQVPKGKRKQQTLDEMKSTFANTLIDRTAELSRITFLRNSLVKEIKGEFQDENRKERKLMREIYNSLPSNKKHWQYGNKYLSNSTRKNIDELTNSLMKNNKNYREYVNKVEEEGEYRKELFGDSQRSDKDYSKNQVSDIKKRLGNSVLKEMKRSCELTEYRNKIYRNKNGFSEKKFQGAAKDRPLLHNKSVHKIKKVLEDDLISYRAEREHEMVQRRIEMESMGREM